MHLCKYQLDRLPSPPADARATNFLRQNPRTGEAFQCKTPAPGSEKMKQNPHPQVQFALVECQDINEIGP